MKIESFSVFLCGSEGFKEFLNIKWLKIILLNKKKSGCFPIFSKLTKNSFKDCSEHTTGLAIATLSLHLHYLTNN